MSLYFSQPYLGLSGGLQTKQGGPAWTLQDNFDNAGLYTQIGTLVTVDSGASDALFFNAASNASDQRVHRSLGFTLSDTTWHARITMNFSLMTAPGHLVTQFNSGTGDPVSVAEDRLTLNLGNDTNSLLLARYDNAIHGGAGWDASGSTIGLSTSTQYYVAQTRLSSTSFRLNVFSDSTYTTNITGSPVTYTIASTIQNLANFHSGNTGTGNSGRIVTGTLDSLRVNNGSTGAP